MPDTNRTNNRKDPKLLFRSLGYASAIFLVICLAILSPSFAKDKKKRACCKRKASSTKCTPLHTGIASTRELEEAYHRALRWGDFPTAIAFLHLLLPTDTSRWKGRMDTLLELYLLTQNFFSARLVADSILARFPQDTHALQLAGLAALRMNQFQEAQEYYWRLADAQQSLRPLWSYMSFLWQAQQFQLLLAVADSVIRHPASRQEMVTLQISETTTQRVPLIAAVYNLIGGVYHRLRQWEKAEQFYKAAQEIEPEFVLPRSNLEQLQQDRQRTSRPAPSAPEQPR